MGIYAPNKDKTEFYKGRKNKILDVPYNNWCLLRDWNGVVYILSGIYILCVCVWSCNVLLEVQFQQRYHVTLNLAFIFLSESLQFMFLQKRKHYWLCVCTTDLRFCKWNYFKPLFSAYLSVHMCRQTLYFFKRRKISNNPLLIFFSQYSNARLKYFTINVNVGYFNISL